MPYRTNQLRQMFLQKFISSRDGPEKCTETRQRCKDARKQPYICNNTQQM